MRGRRFSRAIRWARRTFFTVIGKKAPALTVASLAMIMTCRCATLPIPVTTPADGAPPHSWYMFQAAQRPSSKKSVCGSRSRDALTGGEAILVVLAFHGGFAAAFLDLGFLAAQIREERSMRGR